MLVKMSYLSNPIYTNTAKIREFLINTDQISWVEATCKKDGTYNVSTNLVSGLDMNQSQFSDFEKKLGVKIPVNKE